MKKTKLAVLFTAFMAMMGLSSCLGDPDPNVTRPDYVKVMGGIGNYVFETAYGAKLTPTDQSAINLDFDTQYALINYETGNVRGTVLPSDYGTTGTYQPLPLVQERKELLDFLTNKKAKVLKDWAANSWLMMVVDTPTISYKSGSGMALTDVGFNYVSIGDPNNQQDLYNTGMVEEAD